MATHEWMSDYLKTVSDQIRWKQAKNVLIRELEDHLEDQCEALSGCGWSAQEAQEESLRQMGDPVSVGKALDETHRPGRSWEIVAVMTGLLLLSMGLWIFVFFDGDWVQWFWLPFAGTVFGSAVCFLVSRMNVVYLFKQPTALAYWLLMTIVLYRLLDGMLFNWPYGRLLLVLLYVVGGLLLRKKFGWMLSAACLLIALDWKLTSVVAVRYQWYLPMIAPVAFACFLYGMKNRGWAGYLRSMGMLSALLVSISGRTAGSMKIVLFLSGGCLLLTMILSGAFGRKSVGMTAATIVSMIGCTVGTVALNWERLLGAIQPEQYPTTWGYVSLQIRQVLRESKAIGAGTKVLPFHNDQVSCDFLLAGIAQHFGWLIAVILAASVVLLLLLCLRKTARQHTIFGKLMAIAILVPMVIQTVGYVFNNTGYLLCSFELPLVSYGNSYRLADLALLGLLIAVCRCRTILRDPILPTTK